MTDFMYDIASELIEKQTLDWVTDDIQILLLTAYTQDRTHLTVADVLAAGAEASGPGYSRQSLAGKTISTIAGNKTKVDADDVVWNNLDVGTLVSALVFKNTGSDATSDVVIHIDFPVTTSGGNVTLAWDSDGVYNKELALP